ncbi:type II secretion system ATPase GspE [Methylovulum miyakonense]|uniref:type II secretion system ATPase GspE n=1 Tax=Methylovulum miyakonense TaxID=645578 RepID=UPI00037BCA87|nr:type II secretion system ATPase GspE [Methylovulum miyakonense]
MMSDTSVQEPQAVTAPPDVVGLKLPAYSFAKRHGILVQYGNAITHVLYLDKTPNLALFEIRRFLNQPASFAKISEAEFEQKLQTAYEQKAGHAQQMVENLSDNLDLADMAQHLPTPEDLMESEDEAPIIRLINALLTEAIKENASDIHIESYEKRMVVRFRVDGILREIIEPQREFASMVISRLKVMAKLDIAEKRLPQDGRISLIVGGRTVDVRVSTLPSGYGERVVLRILDKQANQLSLKQLGMNPDELETIQHMISRPHGIILVTGPTGSGKTTSLYAVLNQLNERTRNILTVEDPIEFYLDGIGQTQVNNKVEMTFAKGLRAILRQDPDIVMVGEIRDKETAEISVQASLTGHLVLSTLHTNTAVGAITRLRDMGVEPFLLASSLVGVIAQRLLRKLCPICKKIERVPAQDLYSLGYPAQANTLGGTSEWIEIFQPEGCDKCKHSGFKGRAGIFELIAIDSTMRNMINEHVGEQELEQHARLASRSIQQSALAKVLAGETSLDEAIRITQKE